MILEGTFLRILVPTCFHFGLQVEAPKVAGIEFEIKISARGFQEAPRAAQEGPRASQERPKSAPRATESVPGASKTRSSDAQDGTRSARVQPRPQNQASALQKHTKMNKSIKKGRKYMIIEQKWPEVVDMVLRSTKAKQIVRAGNSFYLSHPF